MHNSVYVIYDRVAKVHYTPFFQANDDHAKRTFMTMAMDENTPMHSSPIDFDLYHIGHYDSDEGQIEGGMYELVLRGAGQPESPNIKKVVG